MKHLTRFSLLFLALTSLQGAAPLADNITAEAFVITKAELRRHMAADETDPFRPATYHELTAALGPGQPSYLVVRFLMKQPGHYSGEAEAKINSGKTGTKLNVMLHFNQGWVEYFIPMDSVMFGPSNKAGCPEVAVTWNSLQAK